MMLACTASELGSVSIGGGVFNLNRKVWAAEIQYKQTWPDVFGLATLIFFSLLAIPIEH
jgi:hypothetical protein